MINIEARGVIRGDQVAKKEATERARQNLPPVATFAPTIRHNTLKLMIAAAVARAAIPEKGNKTRAEIV